MIARRGDQQRVLHFDVEIELTRGARGKLPRREMMKMVKKPGEEDKSLVDGEGLSRQKN
jgi:hypothetical protein